MLQSLLPADSTLRRAFLLGIGVSGAVHVILLLILLVYSVQVWRNKEPLRILALVPTGTASKVDNPAVHLQPAEKPESAGVDSKLISGRIAEMVASAQDQSADENLADLDRMTKQLNSVASDGSIDQLADNLEKWAGLESRSTQPAKPVPVAEFDTETAQLHDVRRVAKTKGGFEYFAVLIDAKGRTVETRMTEAEGKPTYDLLQKLKANPLLEKVYRRLAMPVLDSLVQRQKK